MIFKATISQTAFILRKKEAVLVFYVLFIMVILNFTGNVLYFQGKDTVEMYQPMKLLLLSYNRVYWNASNTLLLIQLYPLLVVCPAGFSLAKEYQLNMRVFLVSRVGNLKYHLSKYLAEFLDWVSFPLSAAGDLSNLSVYDADYRNAVNHYLMKGVYLSSPYLYAVIGTFLFGTVSGLLGVFTAAVSSLIKVKYNIFLFLPVFAALNLSTIFADRFPKDAPSIRWFDYMLIFDDEVKNISYFVIGILALALFSAAAAYVSGRKDCL